MDPLMIHKIQIINKHKKQQILNKFIIYSLAALTCSLFCSSPFWYPPLCATINVFLSVSLPKIASLFVSAKVLFIIGNLIVIFLVGESKLFTSSDSSPASDIHYDERVDKSRSLQINQYSSLEGKDQERKLEEKVRSSSYKEKYWGEELDGEKIILPAEQLSKMADDFIARVNKQRRLEAVLYSTSD